MPRYGLHGKLKASSGNGQKLADILIMASELVLRSDACHLYMISKDKEDPDTIWVTEVWDSRASHEASLSLPSVQEAIARGRPLIKGFSDRFVTHPVGGLGLG